MKKQLCLFLIMLLFSSAFFAQNKAINKDTGVNHLDTLVAKFETEGLGFYSKTKYDSAIKRFSLAVRLIDSLIKTRNAMNDRIMLFVTNTNIGLCYCKEKKFHDVSKYFDNMVEYSLGAQLIATRLKAFIQCTEGDAYILMHQDENAKGEFVVAINNLDEIKFSPYGVVHFKYALKDYAYSDLCQTVGDMFKAKGETLTAQKYYAKIRRKK